MASRRGKCQYVWWWRSWLRHPWRVYYNGGPLPDHGQWKGSIYRWRFRIGPLEVRRWGKERQHALVDGTTG